MIRFLLDTNVLSEVAKPKPEPRVLDWLRAQPALGLAVSVLTLGEIQRGVALLLPGHRRQALEQWLAVELPQQFPGRVLPVNAETSLAWGHLAAEGQRTGRPLPVIDGLLLATAAAHNLSLVTRNQSDCADRGVPIVNPWTT